MAAAVAPPPPQTETAPVAALWDELCAAPQLPPPKRVVICGSTTKLVELARAALSDEAPAESAPSDLHTDGPGDGASDERCGAALSERTMSASEHVKCE